MKKIVRLTESELKSLIRETIDNLNASNYENVTEQVHDEVTKIIYNVLSHKYGRNRIETDNDGGFIIAMPGANPEYVSVKVGFGCY